MGNFAKFPVGFKTPQFIAKFLIPKTTISVVFVIDSGIYKAAS